MSLEPAIRRVVHTRVDGRRVQVCGGARFFAEIPLLKPLEPQFFELVKVHRARRIVERNALLHPRLALVLIPVEREIFRRRSALKLGQKVGFPGGRLRCQTVQPGHRVGQGFVVHRLPPAAQLRGLWNVDYDTSGAIGRRYRRQDEIGTPFCVTVDFDTLEDNAVTVRERDTMEQERVKIEDLQDYLATRLVGC